MSEESTHPPHHVPLTVLPSSGKVEALLAFALMAGLAGWRMRDTFFGVAAVALVVVYVAAKSNGVLLTVGCAAAITLAAAIATRRLWRRPSNH